MAYTKSLVAISGMHCASCANVIQKKVGQLDGVKEIQVNYATEKATVEYDPNTVNLQKMNTEITKLGYTLEEEQTQKQIATPPDTTKSKKLIELQEMQKQIMIMIPMIMISIFVMAWEIGAEPLHWWPKMSETAMNFFHHLLPLFATYALFVVGIPYLKGIVRFAKYKVANMDTLVGIGTSVAYLYSFILSAFEGPLASILNTKENYYDVVIVVIGFITLGKFLEARSKLKTGEAIEKLMGLQAKKALVLRHNKEMEIPIDDVLVHDIMIIKPGQKIPLDGVVIFGSSSVDESMITGESIPVDKKVHDTVIGSTINKQGYLKVEVTQIGNETVLAQIITMVKQAQGSKAQIEQIADRVSALFVPTILVLSGITLVTWLVVGPNYVSFSESVRLGVLSFVGILVIACPCAMGLATPTAIIVGVGKAAENGILIKNAESLEKTNGVNYMVLDKTGTITNGKPTLTDFIIPHTPDDHAQKEQYLMLAASLEKQSEHPLAKAIVDYVLQKKINLVDVDKFSIHEGRGLSGTIQQIHYYMGNMALAKEQNVIIDEKIIHSLTSQGKTPIILISENKALAYLGIADTIKDGAKETVAHLHAQGVKVALLTGDHQQTAHSIAGQVGIDAVFAETLPIDKAKHVRKLQQKGYVVAMVGDGINDAPALAAADVGIAMGTGTDVAIESADITLLGGAITKLPQVIMLARATMHTIKQNLFWAFFYNIVGIPIAAGVLYPFFHILLSPAVAGAAMGLSSVSVVLNSLRLKTKRITNA